MLKRGKVVEKLLFPWLELSFSPSLSSQQRVWGKLFGASLEDTAAIQKSNKKKDLGLPALLLRILWPLLVYSVKSLAFFIQQVVGPPRSRCSAAFYGTSNILQLPISCLIEEFMVARTREALQH